MGERQPSKAFEEAFVEVTLEAGRHGGVELRGVVCAKLGRNSEAEDDGDG